MSDKATFHCSFEDASVTVKIDYALLGQGVNIIKALDFSWAGKPTKKTIPDYVKWMHTVMCQVAQRINKDILYAYPSGGGISEMA